VAVAGVLAFGLVSGCVGPGASVSGALPLVPEPSVVTAGAGEPFAVTAATAVVTAPGARGPAELVARVLGDAAGFAVPVRVASDEGARGLVVLALADDDALPAAAAVPAADGADVPADDGALPAGDEAYALTAGADGVRLTARTADGLLRAAATLRQLLVVGDGVAVPPVQIADAPRYGWRGLSVDVARHFLPVADLERLVDLLFDYKLNVLHVHLTDDQGWRLDVPSRPELVARSSDGAVNGDPGGSYGAGDWAGLVAHAAARGVTVVPEIDVPGHVNAALHAVPALNPGGRAPEPYQGVEVGFSSLRADLPETGRFLSDVFGGLAAMTPGAYLHVGGDEARSTQPDEYAALVRAAAGDVTAAGKRVVGWQEIAAAAPLPAGTVIQYWDERADPTAVLAAARAGAQVLMSPASRAYLDMKYTAGTALGEDWAGLTELRDSYDWDPATVLPGLDPGAVVGVEAAVWTETLRTFDDVTSMLLPRLAALAEVAWSSSAARGWDGFRARVAPQAAAWDRAGLAWYASPQVNWRR
jgi:hexosaminidase